MRAHAPAAPAGPGPPPAGRAAHPAQPAVAEASPTAPEPPRREGPRLEVVASLERGRRPSLGVQQVRYRWPDLVDGPRPPRSRGEGAYVLYHATEVEEDVRIVHTTAVAVGRRDRGARVRVDARISVERRAMLEVMDRQRRRADAFAARWRDRLAARAARRRAWARARRNPWAARGASLWVRAETRLLFASVGAVRGAVRAVVEVPDKAVSGALRAYAHLSTPIARRGLWESLKDPSSLTLEQKSVVLFLSAVLLVGAVGFMNSFFALALPEHADVYRATLAAAVVQFVNMFGFPLVIEPLVIVAVLQMGPVVGPLGFYLGKILGAWALYFGGDALHDAVKKRGKGGRAARAVAWLERNAAKYGFVVLVLANAVPLAPDQIMLVLAVSGMRFRSWMGGIALGTLIRFAAITAGVYVVGPERVELFFANPFAGA